MMTSTVRRREGRLSRRSAERATSPPPRAGGWPVREAWLLFGLALALRLLFWQAGPGTAWPHSAFFKGDALVWLDYARSLRAGVPFELGLPIHPPGTGYLLSWLWDGRSSSVGSLRFTWSLLGAAAVALFFLSLARSFGATVARMAGVVLAASTGLMLLSSSLNAEAPYLVLVAGSFLLFEDLIPRPRPAPLLAWGALQGLACLFRVEHALFVVLMLGLLAGAWWRCSRSGWPLALAFTAFAVPLLPWHARAWSAIARFNEVELPSGPARRLESPPGVTWEEGALLRRGELPAFARPTAAAFVAATVAHRGLPRVRAEDFSILEEAFGYVPRPLVGHPFVSSYGPLNFALANNARARGGFSPALLDEAPALAGGPSRYPPALVAGLPPPQLALVYPPHLRLFNEGYSLGGDWIRRNPAAFAGLAWSKLEIFWSGAALGFTGYGFPLGDSGLRRAVDLVVPDASRRVVAWRVALLLACAAGVVAGWRRLALWPWLLFLASKALTTVLFFGYARLGATVVPTVAVLAALAAERWALPRLPDALRSPARIAAVAALVLAGAEAARCWQGPQVRVEGREVSTHDPVPADVYRDQRVEVRYGR